MCLLTKEEALHFLENVLKLTDIPPLPMKTLNGDERLEFLNTVLSSFIDKEPFQSITLMSIDLDKRRRPTWEEVKADMFAGRGGLCYSQNTFMFVLLTTLGFDVEMTRGTCMAATTNPDNHMCLLLHGLVKGDDLFLADVGLGYSVPRVIPLGFESESPEYTDSFQTYKFVKDGESRMAFKVKRKISPNISNQANEQVTKPENGAALSDEIYEWRTSYFFNPSDTYRELDDLNPYFDVIYSDLTKLVFHTSPRAMHWPGGRYFGIVELKCIVEDDTHTLIKTDVTDVSITPGGKLSFCPAEKTETTQQTSGDLDILMESLVAIYAACFPQFSSGEVRAALENWKKSKQITGTNTQELAQITGHNFYTIFAVERTDNRPI
ncbi:hypothetical protein Btru_073575 [Bulinus truncatus]|nr:hypothetical protein Btru_073575 [Bulinus truncatus]